MEYIQTDEQKMIADSIERMLATHYDFQTRCQWFEQGEYFQHEVWQKLAELGLFAMPLPTEFDGFNASLLDMNFVVSALGQALVVEPFIYCYLGAKYLSKHATDAQKKECFPGISNGSRRVVIALDPVCNEFFIQHSQGFAAKRINASEWQLSGNAPLVFGGQHATDVIILAQAESDETQAFLVPIENFEVKPFTMIDDASACHISLKDHVVSEECLLQYDAQTINLARVSAMSLLSAEAVAIMQTLNIKTKTYLKNREQFGQPLSKFQLLQHRLVEMYVQEEQARSMSLTLASAVDQTQNVDDVLDIAYFTKLKVNDYAQYIGEQSVQLHGGMGVSDEMDIAHYFRRLTCIRHQMGDQTYCLAALAERQF